MEDKTIMVEAMVAVMGNGETFSFHIILFFTKEINDQPPHRNMNKSTNYRILQKLGEGEFGEANLVQYNLDNEKYVMKVI